MSEDITDKIFVHELCFIGTGLDKVILQAGKWSSKDQTFRVFANSTGLNMEAKIASLCHDIKRSPQYENYTRENYLYVLERNAKVANPFTREPYMELNQEDGAPLGHLTYRGIGLEEKEEFKAHGFRLILETSKVYTSINA